MMLAFRLLMGRYRVTCMPGSHTSRPEERRAWGCDEHAPAPVFPDPRTGSFFESDLLDLRRCPACQIGHDWIDLVTTWGVFAGQEAKGPLPLSGGWLDQMQWFADAHQVLAGERVRYLEAARKEAEAKHGR